MIIEFKVRSPFCNVAKWLQVLFFPILKKAQIIDKCFI